MHGEVDGAMRRRPALRRIDRGDSGSRKVGAEPLRKSEHHMCPVKARVVAPVAGHEGERSAAPVGRITAVVAAGASAAG